MPLSRHPVNVISCINAPMFLVLADGAGKRSDERRLAPEERLAYAPPSLSCCGFHGEDLRPLPLEERRARLRKALRGADTALRFSEHLEGDGEAIEAEGRAL